MLSNPLGYVDWIFRSFKALELRVLLVGETGSGKSTLLYQWKEGKFLDLQPRIMLGFEVETFEYPQKCSWNIWNITLGSDIIKPLLRLYVENTQAVLYVHDCDPHLDDSDDRISHLHLWVGLMLEKGCRFLYIVPNKQDLLPPERARELALNLRKEYEKELAPYQDQISWRILDHKTSAKTGEGVWKILDEVYDELSSTSNIEIFVQTRPEPARPKVQTDTISNPSLTLPFKKGSSVSPPDAQTFWASFSNGDMPSWDHHTHLKAAYILVLEYLRNGRSTFAMADTFLAYLRKLRTIQPEKFRHSEHRTMTIFWLVQLQVGIGAYMVDMKLDRYPCWHDFYHVLFHQPILRDARLWSSYYTEDHLFGNRRAWDEWVPPNCQPFPTFLPLLDQSAGLPTIREEPDRLPQFAFVVLQHKHRSAPMDREIIPQALSILESITIRLRAMNMGIPPYSKTQACFWIHMVRACLRSLDPSDSSESIISTSQLNFADFKTLFLLQPTLWAQYYSRESWHGLASRIEFVAPDRKPLPDVINMSACADQEKMLGNQLKSKETEENQQSLEEALLDILIKPGDADITVPSCCAGSVDCDGESLLPGRKSTDTPKHRKRYLF